MSKSRDKIELSTFIGFLLTVGVITFFVNYHILGNKNSQPDFTYEVFEPEASISEDLEIVDFQQTNDNQGINSIPYIDSVQLSPDNSVALVESWVLDPAVLSDISNTKKLTIVNSDGVILNEVENSMVIDAKFVNNNQIYYQKTGDDFGIFLYSLNNSTKCKFVETSDNDYFKNIVMIDDITYFFIQPKTGKYGYGNVETGELNIIGQKASNEDSIEDNNKALFFYPIVSSDRKSIYIVEKIITDQNFYYVFESFPIDETSFSAPVFKQKIITDYNGDFEISQDREFVTIGKNGLTINTNNNSVVFQGSDSETSNIKISPDNLKAFVCTGNGKFNTCKITTISNEGIFNTFVESNIPDGIRDFSWMDNDRVIFIIGKSMYTYSISTKQLEKVFEEKGDYRILARNEKKDSVIIMKEEEVKELSFVE